MNKYVYRITQPDAGMVVRVRLTEEAVDLLDYLNNKGWFSEDTYIEQEDDNEIIEF